MHLRWWHTASLITYALRRLHTNPSDWIKNKALPKKCFIFWRRQSDLNRCIRVLQTRALPLGYVAILIFLKKIGHKKLGEFCVLFFMERMTRLELATSTLARWRSTRWATSAYNWCLRSESNQWHEDFQSSALPTELQRQKMATRNGLEPSTSSVTG